MTEKVLVTGGSGFIGSHVLDALAASGAWEIHAVTRLTAGQRSGPWQWHLADLLDASEVHSVVQRVRPTRLLHLAWITTHGMFWNHPDNLRWVQMGLDLLRSFHAIGGRHAVIAGTGAEYDWSHRVCHETSTPRRPSSFYGVSKHALHLMSEAYCAEVGVRCAWAHLFWLYGPRENPSRLIAYAINALIRGEIARCTHGRQVRDFLHVADAASGLVHLLERGAEGPINVASGQPIALRELVEIAADSLGKRELVEFGAVQPTVEDPPYVVADTDRINHELGWHPSMDHRVGLERTVDWWRRQCLDSASPVGPEKDVDP